MAHAALLVEVADWFGAKHLAARCPNRLPLNAPNAVISTREELQPTGCPNCRLFHFRSLTTGRDRTEGPSVATDRSLNSAAATTARRSPPQR
jgi:hypothetical protein